MTELITLLSNHEFGLYGFIIVMIIVSIFSISKFCFSYIRKLEFKISSMISKGEFERYIASHKEDHASFFNSISSEMNKLDLKLDNLASGLSRNSEIVHKLAGEIAGRDASIINLIRALEGKIPMPNYTSSVFSDL
jgi:hypothetical protein